MTVLTRADKRGEHISISPKKIIFHIAFLLRNTQENKKFEKKQLIVYKIPKSLVVVLIIINNCNVPVDAKVLR